MQKYFSLEEKWVVMDGAKLCVVMPRKELCVFLMCSDTLFVCCYAVAKVFYIIVALVALSKSTHPNQSLYDIHVSR